MSEGYKPAGYTSVAAYIVSERAQSVIDFAVAVFDATPLRRIDRPDGSIMHAEFRIDDTVVMIADPPPGMPPQPALLHVYVPDANETHRRALAAGATSIQEPAQKEDRDLRGGVRDLQGNSWWFGTQMK